MTNLNMVNWSNAFPCPIVETPQTLSRIHCSIYINIIPKRIQTIRTFSKETKGNLFLCLEA